MYTSAIWQHCSSSRPFLSLRHVLIDFVHYIDKIIGNLYFFSLISQKYGLQWPLKFRRICVGKVTLATENTWMIFHTNPCKFQNFQTVVKYFGKHYLAQISFLFVTGNWALKCVWERFNESLKISKFARICMENHSSVTRWQELFFSYKSC